MPELPEVETVCRGLRAAELCSQVKRVWRSPLDLRIGAHWRRDQEHSQRLLGRIPGGISRRGKYILWDFCSDNPKDETLQLVVHLGMTGALMIHRQGVRKLAHTHLSLSLGDERRIDFVDPRRFGGIRVDTPNGHRLEGPLRDLGPEPLSSDFCASYLEKRLRGRTRPIRDLLLDQHIVVGIGNIYAVEALYQTRVSPLRAGGALSFDELSRLTEALKQILASAISHRGTTLRDYRDPNGQAGANQLRLRAYGRAGESCLQCRTELLGIKIGGRGAVFCPKCQT